jgi:hypothetical protein
MLRDGLVLAVLLISLSWCTAGAQSPPPSSGPDTREANSMALLEDGSISGDTYHNAELGFKYQFPHGWVANDKNVQEKAIVAGHQFAWGDDGFAKSGKRSASPCAKNLLLVTKYPEEMRLNQFNPAALLIAADPRCAPGVVFPSSVKDQVAIQEIVKHLGIFFKTLPITSRGPAQIRSFDNGGRVLLEVSQAFSVYSHDPGSATAQNIRSSTLIMQAGKYWVMCTFVSSDDVELEHLRATKFFFDPVPTGPSESK